MLSCLYNCNTYLIDNFCIRDNMIESDILLASNFLAQNSKRNLKKLNFSIPDVFGVEYLSTLQTQALIDFYLLPSRRFAFHVLFVSIQIVLIGNQPSQFLSKSNRKKNRGEKINESPRSIIFDENSTFTD